MTKATVAHSGLTRKYSKEMPDGSWESAEATFFFEEDVPEGVNKDSHGAGLRASVKAQIDAEMSRQKEEIEELARKLIAPTSAAEEFAEEVGTIAVGPIKEEIIRAAEEKPPMPEEEVRTPIDAEGNELKVFKVQSMEVALTSGGDKFLKVFGGPWKRPWVPAWRQAAELLFDDIESMDLGVIGPPYPLHALVKMGEYKGRPSPDSIDHWKRIDG